MQEKINTKQTPTLSQHNVYGLPSRNHDPILESTPNATPDLKIDFNKDKEEKLDMKRTSDFAHPDG